ncbi:extradiol dioxygenase [Pedobacter psychrophilus]|uniref:Extradiol dioxygenase n=1 Tax=Pedobacter psychrophilus TaxID=1826909 RepID=A0A179DDC9_9SPHI|nr:extradiol dioxygenase [Pedobacter psychrophilus]OAQ38904.1 extradiol dioxygenase [Pedobacter psychrophilus]
MEHFKPNNYNSLSPYLIVDEAEKLITQLKAIFNCTELRRMERENGKIAHLELKFDDSVLMISDSLDEYPSHQTMLHIYVPDVMETFIKAKELGCEIIEEPIKKENDSD